MHAIDITVCGGPTAQVRAGPSTRTGGKSTVLRMHWVATLTVSDEMVEIERRLSGDLSTLELEEVWG